MKYTRITICRLALVTEFQVFLQPDQRRHPIAQLLDGRVPICEGETFLSGGMTEAINALFVHLSEAMVEIWS
ncbi:MAG: hypothetical protein ABL974_19420 [Prosthecobacter sp.]